MNYFSMQYQFHDSDEIDKTIEIAQRLDDDLNRIIIHRCQLRTFLNDLTRFIERVENNDRREFVDSVLKEIKN